MTKENMQNRDARAKLKEHVSRMNRIVNEFSLEFDSIGILQRKYMYKCGSRLDCS